MSECRICTATAPNVDLLCTKHRNTLSDWLNEIPDGIDHCGHPADGLLTDLNTSVARLDRFMTYLGAGASSETLLPWRENASAARIGLVATLMHWTRITAERYEDEHDPLADAWLLPPALAEWLLRNLNTLIRHEAAPDAYRDVRNAVNRAREACDLTAVRKFPVGPCPVIKDGCYCQGEIWAALPTADHEPAVLDCQTCKSSWDSTRWYRLSQQMARRRRQLAVAV